MLLWEENFEKPPAGTPALFAAMQKPTVLTGGREIPSGMGLGIGHYRGLPVFEGSGGDYGIASKFAFFPTQHLAVAVLCNEDNVVMGGLARVNPDVFTCGIADIYLADALGPVEAASNPVLPNAVKLSDKELMEKTGLYSIGGVDQPALLTVDHGTLMVRDYYRDDFDIELTPIGPNRLLLRNSVPMVFTSATPNQPKEWRVGEGKDARVWQLVTFAPTASEVRSYAGDYRSEELGVTYTLEARDSALAIQNPSCALTMLSPFSKDVFVGDVAGIVKFTQQRSRTRREI